MLDDTGGYVLSSTQIHKLGHELAEIRVRALDNIISKLKYGLINEGDLQKKDLFNRLLYWFTFDECPEKEKVLKLMRRLVKADSNGKLIVRIQTPTVLSKLQSIRSVVDNEKLRNIVDDIIFIITSFQLNDDPSSEDADVKKDSSEKVNDRCVETPRTTNVINYEEDKAVELLQEPSSPPKTHHVNHYHGYFRSNSSTSPRQLQVCFTYFVLPWQPMVLSDRYVLAAVETSLKEKDSGLVLQSCQFFMDVMLKDFPAEVFLQRPTIVKNFFNLLKMKKSYCEDVRWAVLNCLQKLCANIHIRIQYYNDPCVLNSKQEDVLECLSVPASSSVSVDSGDVQMSHLTPGEYLKNVNVRGDMRQVENNNCCSNESASEDTAVLKLQQMGLPYFCLMSLCHSLVFVSPRCNRTEPTRLVASLINLLPVCVTHSVWFSSDPVAVEATEIFRRVFTLLGDLLAKCNFRRKASDSGEPGASRLTYLQLLAACRKLLVTCVPEELYSSVASAKLKSQLVESIFDFPISEIYSSLHSDIVGCVRTFAGEEKKSFERYANCTSVCKSMKSAVKFLKNCDSLEADDFLKTADEALECVAYHRNMKYIQYFIDTCVNKEHRWSLDESQAELLSGILLKFMAHTNVDIKRHTYYNIHKHVVIILGVDHATKVHTSVHLGFLFNTSILNEIICHGTTCSEKVVRQYAEEILLHLLKGKFLMSDQMWRKFVENLIPSLPLLLCYAGKNCALGRAISKLIDPDISQTIQVPQFVVFKGNVSLLFSSEASMREEAFTRLIWLLTKEKNSYEKLPDPLFVQGVKLHDMLLHEKPLEATRLGRGFYEVSSLCQVLDLLRSPAVESSVRRSALTQIAVMMEDPDMHSTFIQEKGIKTILDIFRNSLVQKELNELPEFSIPCISILKNLSLMNSNLRQELSRKQFVLYCIFRAGILFHDNKKLHQDIAQLLCLLLYSDFILPVPESMTLDDLGQRRYSVSFPELVVKLMKLPLLCHTHWRNSRFTQSTLKDVLLSDNKSQKMLQFCWNIEWFGGVEGLLNISISPEIPDSSSDLMLFPSDLAILKATAIPYNCRQHLAVIENADTHRVVFTSLNTLTQYLTLHKVLYGSQLVTNEITDSSTFRLENCWKELPWKDCLLKFLLVSPSCSEDHALLTSILEFMILYMHMYSNLGAEKESYNWIVKLLKSTTQPIVNMLNITNIHILRELCQTLLMACQSCAFLENILRNSEHKNNSKCSWSHLANSISFILKSSDTQHFYNLASLDVLLSCLSHVTSGLGWSKGESGSVNTKQLWADLISSLSDIIGAFHFSVGSASFKGISITRYAVLCLNHILCETQEYCGQQGWEIIWVSALTGHANDHNSVLWWIPSLLLSRDPVIRAGSLQLLAGMCSSERGCTFVFKTLPLELLPTVFSFVVDQKESCMVREQAAVLLTNITSHCVPDSKGFHNKDSEEDVDVILGLVNKTDLYTEVAVLLSQLYIGTHVSPSVPLDDLLQWAVTNTTRNRVSSHQNLWKDNNILVYNKTVETVSCSSIPASSELNDARLVEGITVVSTPSFVRAVCWFLVNLIALEPSQSLTSINKLGIIRLLFSCLGNFPQFVDEMDHCSMMLCTDILEMYAGVCCVLSKCVSLDRECRNTVLQIQDSIHTLLSFLNPVTYGLSDSPQHLFLRNKLWCEVFRFLSALLVNQDGDCNEGYMAIRNGLWKCGHEPFFLCVKSALKDTSSKGLLDSALTSLTSLLSEEAKFNITEKASPDDSCFDNIVSSVSLQTLLDENSPCSSSESLQSKDAKSSDADCEKNMFGAELCDILLRLFDVYTIKQESAIDKSESLKVLNSVTGALSSLLAVSREAKQVALRKGLLDSVIGEIKELYVKLSLESVDCLRRVCDKKRVCPYLRNLDVLFGLLTNFFHGDTEVKKIAAEYGFADLIHKVWLWCSAVPTLLTQALKMLSTFTTKSYSACHSLVLTSTVPGVSMRKSPTSVSLLHALMAFIVSQMDLAKPFQDFAALILIFDVLKNSCQSQECRVIIAKSNFLQSLSKLNPASVKKHSIEGLWVNFLADFTYHPEGQLALPKIQDALSIIFTLTKSPNLTIREASMAILRNIAFHQFNRSRLLSSGEFLQVLQLKLTEGTLEEKTMVATIVWALAANNQKAKLIVKCCGIEAKLEDVFNEISLVNPESDESFERLETISYVLDILHGPTSKVRSK